MKNIKTESGNYSIVPYTSIGHLLVCRIDNNRSIIEGIVHTITPTKVIINLVNSTLSRRFKTIKWCNVIENKSIEWEPNVLVSKQLSQEQIENFKKEWRDNKMTFI